MPRKPIIRSNKNFYHLTGRSNNRENFYLHMDLVWRFMIDELKLLQEEFDVKIAAFVLMDNHFHLILLTPKENIDRIMYFFMKRVTIDIQKYSGRINKVFGGRYRGCLVLDQNYLFNVYKYVYRNPIRAGLCDKVQDYRYSTWRETKLKIESPLYSQKKSVGELKWLNDEFNPKEAERIKFSLHKTVYDPHLNFKPKS